MIQQRSLRDIPSDLRPFMSPQEHLFAGGASPITFSPARRGNWYRPWGIIIGTMASLQVREARLRIKYVPVTDATQWLLSQGLAFTGGEIAAVLLGDLDIRTGKTVGDPRLVIGTVNRENNQLEGMRDRTKALVGFYEAGDLHLREVTRRSKER